LIIKELHVGHNNFEPHKFVSPACGRQVCGNGSCHGMTLHLNIMINVEPRHGVAHDQHGGQEIFAKTGRFAVNGFNFLE